METKHWVYGILVYNWVLLGIFSLNLPSLPEPTRSFISVGCIGWLIHEWFEDNDSGIEYYLKGMSPRIMTNCGCFAWDGITKPVDVDGYPHYLYYGNGYSFQGMTARGNVAIVVPQSHVIEFGKHRVVRTELNYGNVPDDVYLGEVSAVLTGRTLMEQFRNVKNVAGDVDISRQYQSVQKVAEARGVALDNIMRLFSDASMLGKMLNPQDTLKQELLRALDVPRLPEGDPND